MLLVRIIGHSSFSVCQGAFPQDLRIQNWLEVRQQLAEARLKAAPGYQMGVGRQVGVVGRLARQN